jgi:MFS family permease
MLSKKIWGSIIILGFLGSLAWRVENQLFNTFIYNNITPDPRPISWMVAASAITATIASILIGALSDRVRFRWGRKPFLLIGYLGWGKDLFPEDKRGQFGGYVIFSQVALTVVPGPLIGRWLTTQFGVQSILNRKQAFIPTSLIFQVTAIATLLTLLPVLKTKSHPTTLKG